jgi:hypothetical protein
MQPLCRWRAVPLSDQSRTVPPSRPKSDPPPRAAAVKSLPLGCDLRAAARPARFRGRQTAASLSPSGRHFKCHRSERPWTL